MDGVKNVYGVTFIWPCRQPAAHWDVRSLLNNLSNLNSVEFFLFIHYSTAAGGSATHFIYTHPGTTNYSSPVA